MGNLFDDSQAQIARYWYERVPYTSYIATLLPGKTNIFSATDISTATEGKKIGILGNLAMTQAAYVQLATESAGNTRLTAAAAYPPSLRPVMTAADDGIRSSRALGIYLTNSSGAVVNNAQINYTVAVKELTIADKVLRNMPLSAAEQSIQQKYQIGQQGIRPLAISKSLQQNWLSRVLSEEIYGYQQAVTSSPTTLENLVPGHNELLVITSIAMGGVPVGNQVTLTIQRDSDVGYVSILGDNLSLEYPLSVWIPATRQFSIGISAVTATAAATVRLTVKRLALSTVLQALFGKLNPAHLSREDLHLYEQVIAGVVV